MRQSKAHPPVPSQRPETVPVARFRYHSVPPQTVLARLKDIAAAVPPSSRHGDVYSDRIVELPCADIFATLTPKIRLGRLAELLPEFFGTQDGYDKIIALPAASLALGYHLVELREDLDPAFDSFSEPTAESIIEPAAEADVEHDWPATPEIEVHEEHVVLPPAHEWPPAAEHEAYELPTEAAAPDGSKTQRLEAAPAPMAIPQAFPTASPKFPVLPPAPAAPVFPHAISPQVPPLAVNIPLSEEAQLVEVEHLPVSGAMAHQEITSQEGLQGIFLTEEHLDLERVVELCGSMPGINSCVLTHGPVVIASHNVPENIDLVSLSAHASEMLDGMRESAAKMGIGMIPAVTVHSEKGQISFVHRDDLCMLVWHKERGFVPGVREKLTAVLGELTQANLPLPVAEARPELGE